MPSPAVCKACLIDAHGRRLRYPLASILMRGVLAKVAGQESRRGIAHWAKLREQELQLLFALKRETMPHYSTWSRVLGHGVDPKQLEQTLGQFFATSLNEGSRRQRGSLQVC
jgi:DDE_Tnp_1-associated